MTASTPSGAAAEQRPSGAYTSGPWHACQGGRCTCGLIWDASGDIHVATAISGRHVGQPWHACDIIITDEEQHANARLIAAAPEMAAAAADVMSHRVEGATRGDLRDNDASREALSRLAAALALALQPAPDALAAAAASDGGRDGL